MAKIAGSFALPMPPHTSQLVNDTRFSSIREYVLNSASLSGSTQLDISDLSEGSVIYRIDLVIFEAFSDESGDQHDIAIASESGDVLMSNEWNDPNTLGTYTASCHTTISSSNKNLHLTHSLSNIVSGAAILRLHIYNNSAN